MAGSIDLSAFNRVIMRKFVDTIHDLDSSFALLKLFAGYELQQDSEFSRQWECI